MPAQITILGMGQIGASMGLALTERGDVLKRVGHDKEPSASQKAKQIGAVDEINFNLPASVSDADIVVLAMPLDGALETFEFILPDLKEGAVVIDTCPIKTPLTAFAKANLPEGRYYIGLLPATNAEHFLSADAGIDTAKADLFNNGLMGIVAPGGTPGEVVKLATDLTRMLGAAPLYLDPAEADSIMTAMHLLPQLLSASLLEQTVDKPGWREARKFGGRAYANVTAVMDYHEPPASLLANSLAARENLKRHINGIITSLVEFRDQIDDSESETLKSRFEKAYEGRGRWWAERQKSDWASEDIKQPEMPGVGDYIRKMFFGRFGQDNKDKKK